MVEREITDGRRIAELLAAELEGRSDPPFDAVALVDENWDAEPDGPGGRVFTVRYAGTSLADVVIQPDRAHLDLDVGLADAERAAAANDLRARPKATTPPGLLVFVENGAAVKRATDVLVAAAKSV
ncbi:MAG: hypothetical protein ABEJ76_07970 [Halanaeroarchaeum sp.]